jgi:hypothetical protein
VGFDILTSLSNLIDLANFSEDLVKSHEDLVKISEVFVTRLLAIKETGTDCAVVPVSGMRGSVE